MQAAVEQTEVERVDESLAVLRAVVADVRPGTWTADDALRLLRAFAEVERLGQAGKAMAARWVEETESWRRSGHRSAAHFLAATTATPVGEAVAVLETARRLEELPATAEAVRAGVLSAAQAREITSAADSTSEGALLAAAQRKTMAELRDHCRRLKAASTQHAERYERVRRGRYFRHWTDRDGAVRLDARLTADDGARLIAAVDEQRQKVFLEARRAGRREPFEAYAADALVALADATGRGASGPRAMVHVRVDHAALVRGHTEGDETCDIPGIGPVPVATARMLASDSVLKVIVTKGVDVVAVSHAGRTIPAHIRSALIERDPCCVVPDCGVRDGLEIDHIVPFAEGGPTRLSNMARLCHWHHMAKTHHGYRLAGGPGCWTWIPPPGGRDR